MLRPGDNGVGIDPAIVNEGKEGHFALQGTRERAGGIMAQLTVETSRSAGLRSDWPFLAASSIAARFLDGQCEWYDATVADLSFGEPRRLVTDD